MARQLCRTREGLSKAGNAILRLADQQWQFQHEAVETIRPAVFEYSAQRPCSGVPGDDNHPPVVQNETSSAIPGQALPGAGCRGTDRNFREHRTMKISMKNTTRQTRQAHHWIDEGG